MTTYVVVSKISHITESEWKVMEVTWEESPVTAKKVVDALAESEKWKPQTVKTLLARLVKKGVLRVEAEGNRFQYFPVVQRETAVMVETESFLDRICRGSLTPMLAQMVKGKRQLSDEEVQALRDLLEENQNMKGQKS